MSPSIQCNPVPVPKPQISACHPSTQIGTTIQYPTSHTPPALCTCCDSILPTRPTCNLLTYETPHGAYSFGSWACNRRHLLWRQLSLQTSPFIFFFKNKHLTSQRVSKNLAHTLRLSEGSLKVAQRGLFSHLVSHHDHQSYCADCGWHHCVHKKPFFLPSRREETVTQKHLEHSGPRSQPGQHGAAKHT